VDWTENLDIMYTIKLISRSVIVYLAISFMAYTLVIDLDHIVQLNYLLKTQSLCYTDVKQ